MLCAGNRPEKIQAMRKKGRSRWNIIQEGGPLHEENREQVLICGPHPEGCFPGIRAGRARAVGGLALTGLPLLRRYDPHALGALGMNCRGRG